ncbi:MAG: Crp/Fnr family transcriptional regulator [Phenylobacterium sp.]|uniref:Crp/Fnr family transcriptional regulator n=1 Tax=Phenylobacterium sp. TaxID=1871053 RepID=UPI002730327E|nr:Crp/Fnr family transcriptional regulator [Phenylobacterium sp.]MDP2011562.1 Crp/Fnr family transcriptional regulator [Phenylobacterium sp.]
MDDGMALTVAGAPGAIPVRARAGDILFRPGDPCRGFIALRAGTIRVGLTSSSGREIRLYRVRPGDICLQTFACLVQDRSYAAEGVAESDLDAVLLPPALFDALMSRDGGFRAAVLASVANRFSELESVVQALAFTGLPARVAAFLLARAPDGGALAFTHEAVAAEIGSAREAVSRQLGLFARQGLVAMARGRISLNDVAGLRRAAEGRG